jgi:hypothetical protein
MRRALALLVTISTVVFADNPNGPDPGSFDIEPPLLIPNRDDQRAERGEGAPARDVDLAKLEKEFVRANRSLVGLDRLLKIGALSKLEVEQRRLRVVHLEFELAHARLVAAKEQMLQKDSQLNAGQIAHADVTPAENNLALAIEAAHAASAKRETADLEAAQANVDRQKKLLALGSARKTDVARAEQKLAELRARQNQ